MAQPTNPFLRGFYGAQDQQRQNAMGSLAQLQGVLGIQQAMAQQAAQQQALAEQQQLRGVLSQLGPDAAPEQVLGAIRPFVGPNQLSQQVMNAQNLAAQREARASEGAAQRENQLLIARDRIQANLEAARQRGEDQRTLAQMQMAGRRELAQIAASLRQPPAPIVQTNESGDVTFFNPDGSVRARAPGAGKPSAEFAKRQEQQRQQSMDINRAITELTEATKDGGLIDRSTGSGAGALADTVAGFFGQATEGAVAAGQMAPVYDLVLKMVPRFEGPQSDKDTASYERASGQLANPAIPNPQKKEAAKEILRLLKNRRNQFSMRGQDAAGAAPAPQAPSLPTAADIDAELARRNSGR